MAREFGRLPNVFRHAPTMEQLRMDRAFEGLPPPVGNIQLAGPASHRYVRQDDPLWAELHQGVLTTGRVRGALGLYEKSAAKKLGIPNSRAGHSELLRAYRHMCHQAPPSSCDPVAEAAAAAHNAAAVAAYNGLKQEAAAGAAAGQLGQLSSTHRQGRAWHARQQMRRREGHAETAAGLQASAWSVDEEQKLKKARALSSAGVLSICCSWGSAQEAASLLQVAGVFPLSQLAEVGLCRLQQHQLPPGWGFGPGSLPPIGASPDALIWHPPRRPPLDAAQPAPPAGGEAGSVQRAAQSGDEASMVAPWDIDGLMARLQLAGHAATQLHGSSHSGLAAPDPAGWLIEAVEVKNTCPFGHSRRGGRLRTSEFAVADRGPRGAVPPEWVPQLQLHMLCTGTPSGLLVSRSATKGTNIFRMQRDDELLRLMLLVISRLWEQHVVPRRPPPPDVYASWREHHDMMRRIGDVARGAKLVAATLEGHHLPTSDPRWFLD